MAMRTSEVLRAAAGRIESYSSSTHSLCCCGAINRTTGNWHERAAAIGALFVWFGPGHGGYWWPSFSDADQEARRLALLFAALIAEDEERTP